MKESTLQREVMLAVSKTGARVFRNNVGFGLIVQHANPGAKQAIIRECIAIAERKGGSAYQLHYGLCPGSSDIIGFNRDGLFMALEVKSLTGRLTEEQSNFLDAVNNAGGIGAEVRSITEALDALKRKL